MGFPFLEIGCGRGEFLALLCKIGNNSGVGIDPSTITGELTPPIPENLHFIREYFSPRHSKYLGDLICCRHTLEHINEPAKFVRTLREMIGNKYSKISFFEVPDVSRILKETAFWDISSKSSFLS